MIMYELSSEFDVSRRIGWEDVDLGVHIDEVMDYLRQAQGVLSMDARADLDTGRVHLVMRYESLVTDDPEHLGCTLLGVAIRASGGAHQGLLPLSEEAGVKPDRHQRSGLRIPTWNIRNVASAETSTDLR